MLLFRGVIMNHTAPPAAARRQGVNNLYDNVAADASFRVVLHPIATDIAGAVAPAPVHQLRVWEQDLLALALSKWHPFDGQEEDDPRHDFYLGRDHLTHDARYDALRVAIAAGWVAPPSGLFPLVLRAALEWAHSNVSRLRALQQADFEAAPGVAGAAGNHWRHRVHMHC